MSSLKSQCPLQCPQTHTQSFLPPLPSPGYHVSGKETEVCGSGSPWFFPVIRAWLAGLPQFPEPSVVSLTWSPVLNPNPHGTFSWSISKSPFTTFLPAVSLLHSSKLLRELYILLSCFLSCLVLLVMAAAPVFKSRCQSSSAAPFPTPPTIGYTGQHYVFFQLFWAAIVSPGRCGPMMWSQSSPRSHTGAITRRGCLPVTSWVEVTPIPVAQSVATAI